MFEPVDDLAKRLPHPDWTGDPINDRRAIERHIANGRRLRSEAFRCVARALITSLRGDPERRTIPLGGVPSPTHQM